MRFLAIEDEGVTECEITSEVDDFLEAVKATCDDEYTLLDFLNDAKEQAEVTLALADLVEGGYLKADEPEGVKEHRELAEESLRTIEIMRKRAGELGYL